MAWMIWMGVGGVVVVAVAVWSLVSRERDGVQQDHGTMSGQWRNEQRTNDRESRDR